MGADGTIYCGVRGRHPTLTESAVNGRMYAVRDNAAAGFSALWQYEIEGQLDWAPPAIGTNGGLYFGTSAAFPPAEQITWYALRRPR